MLLAFAALAPLGTAPSAAADSAPQLSSVTFAKPAIVGRTATLQLRATDRERSVSGAVVSFAGEGTYGTSACRPSRRRTRTGAGRTVTLTVPHRFSGTEPRGMLVRVDSGGCSAGGGAVLQPFTVTPVQPGETPKQPEPAGPPVPILASVIAAGTAESTGGTGVTLPPGVTDPLPTLPGVAPLPTLPGDPTPELPPPPVEPPPLPVEPPPLPEVPGLPSLPRAFAAAGCRDADLVPTPRNLARIRRATLCLVNVERRAHGLRTLRANRRLARAATMHSRDMVSRGYFAHLSPEGNDLTKRLIAAKWLPRPPGWLAGETSGFGETPLSTPRATVIGWQQSTGHRENNLDKVWRIGGIGVAVGVPGLGTSGATYTALYGR